MRRFILAISTFGVVFASSTDAWAIRWSLGLATELTPLVVDPGRPDDLGTPFRLGVRPIVDFEVNPYLAFGVYAPFVVLRTGEGGGAASSGAESVFGLSVAGRYPIELARADRELFVYGKLRGGFGTIAGRAGPLFGGAAGAAYTWLDTGRGVFADLSTAHLAVSSANVVGGRRDVRRTTFSVTVGLVFRLGGERWRLGGQNPAKRAESAR